MFQVSSCFVENRIWWDVFLENILEILPSCQRSPAEAAGPWPPLVPFWLPMTPVPQLSWWEHAWQCGNAQCSLLNMWVFVAVLSFFVSLCKSIAYYNLKLYRINTKTKLQNDTKKAYHHVSVQSFIAQPHFGPHSHSPSETPSPSKKTCLQNQIREMFQQLKEKTWKLIWKT